MYRNYFIFGEWLAASLTVIGLITGIISVGDSIMLFAMLALSWIIFNCL